MTSFSPLTSSAPDCFASNSNESTYASKRKFLECDEKLDEGGKVEEIVQRTMGNSTPPRSPRRIHPTLNSEKEFESPLKRKKISRYTDLKKEETRPERLDKPEAATVSVTPLPPLPPLSPELQAEVNRIYCFLDENPGESNQQIKMRVHEICFMTVRNELKMAELGVLYFYLTKQDSVEIILNSDSILVARLAEIRQEAESYVNQMLCLKHNPQAAHLIPSGKVAYIFRAFIRMIFTPDGSFNRGGCLAVKILLNTDLGYYLSGEIRAQILTIVNRLIQDPDFYKLFVKNFDYIHPAAVDAIRTDFHLKTNEQVGSLHVCWAKLLTLFLIFGQIDEGNCFAFAPTFNFLRQKPELILTILDQFVETGSLAFDGQMISFEEVIEGRKSYEKDFDQELKVVEAVQLTAFSVIQATFEAKPVYVSSREIKTLGEIFGDRFSSNVDEAKQRYLALKRNLFQQAVLGFFQFLPLNMPTRFSSKDNFFTYLNDFVLTRFLQEFPDQKDFDVFLKRFDEELWKQVWFIDYRNRSSQVKEGRLQFARHSQGILLEGDPLSSFAKFSNMRRLFYLKEGCLVPLDTLSDVAKCFYELAEKIVLDGCQSAESFQRFLSEPACKEEIAKMVEKFNCNSNVSFSWKKYYDSDCFLIVQNGANTAFTMQWDPIVNSLAHGRVELNAVGVESYFVQLCNQLREYAINHPTFLEGPKPLLLAHVPCHAFNFCPSLFSDFFTGDTAVQMDEKIYQRAKRLQTRRSTVAIRKRILYAAFDKDLAEEALKVIPKKRLTLWQFHEEIKKHLSSEQLKKFDSAFESVLLEVSLKEYEKKLPAFLASIDKQMSASIIIDYIKNRLPARKKTHCSLTQLARWTHEVLLRSNLGFMDVHVLERKVADLFGLPVGLTIANLNWMAELTEIPAHANLRLMFSLSKNCYIFCKEVNGTIQFFEENDVFASDLLKKTILYFEGK